jgi:peptidoglycan/xylan/chitin deacetylase (PgdA/CDA1 family)
MIDFNFILMLHRVGERNPNGVPSNQNLLLNCDEIEAYVNNAKKNGWSFISTDEFYFNISRSKNFKKCINLTFDDGYKDNYDVGFPLLSSLNVPFTVYVTTNFISNFDFPWWLKLEDVLLNSKEIKLPESSKAVVMTHINRDEVFQNIRNIILADSSKSSLYINWLLNFNTDKKYDHIFMNWSDVTELSSSNLATIGAHSVSHSSLALSNEINSFNEISKSKKIIEENCNIKVNHYAIPYGTVNDYSIRDIDYIREIGFATNVTTSFGVHRNGYNVNLLLLPRIFWHPTLTLQETIKKVYLHLIKQRVKEVLN